MRIIDKDAEVPQNAKTLQDISAYFGKDHISHYIGKEYKKSEGYLEIEWVIGNTEKEEEYFNREMTCFEALWIKNAIINENCSLRAMHREHVVRYLYKLPLFSDVTDEVRANIESIPMGNQMSAIMLVDVAMAKLNDDGDKWWM